MNRGSAIEDLHSQNKITVNTTNAIPTTQDLQIQMSNILRIPTAQSTLNDLNLDNILMDDISDNPLPSLGLPDEYFEIQHHPHSGISLPTIIPLDSDTPELSQSNRSISDYIPIPTRPWAPFHTLGDFLFTENMIVHCLSKDATNTILDGIHGGWATNHALTIRTYQDVQESLSVARKFIQQFVESEISHQFQGNTHNYKFLYRDPWQWILSLVQDPTLSNEIMWFPVKKFLHTNGKVVRIYDELNTGDAWWDYQDSINPNFEYPHPYFPLHVWLDKSNVSSTTKKHPILLRAGALPGHIRNGSGNGGGILIGYMPIIGDPGDSPKNEDDSLSSVKLAQFKREIYHKVLSIIFKSLRKPSISGEVVRCGDGITRIIFPGFLIDSVDLEEAYSLCGTRGCRANYPCPRCLVPQVELDSLTVSYLERSDYNMVEVFNKAKVLPSGAAEQLLKNNGLHFVANCFWRLCRSCPYHAYSYDVLHAFDSGEWGKHQWRLLLSVLDEQQTQQTQLVQNLNRNMAQVPSWTHLKHFENVCKVEYSDGNSFRDILKCIIPCLTGILPSESPLFQAIHWCAIFRAIIGLKVISEEHVSYLEQTVLPTYQGLCSEISDGHKKSYKYPKHHMMSHAPTDLRRKGCIDNYSTRPGEGFQQEVKQAYAQTNFKNTEIQMARIDENQEAIAQIRMFVDLYDNEGKKKELENNIDNDNDNDC